MERKGKTLWTGNEEGKKITIHTSCTEQEEAEYMAKRIFGRSGAKAEHFQILQYCTV